MIRLSVLMILLTLSCCSAAEDPMQNVQKDRNVIASQMQDVLEKELRSWYPLCLDTVYGGYYSDIDYQWKVDGRQDKMIVTQARHVWSTSNTLLSNPRDTVLLEAATHGFRFLKQTMWDSVYGGFFDLVNRRGEPLEEDGQIIKRAYGGAFAIYALAAYYRATGDTSALQLARQEYLWLETHSRDTDFGGYFQFMTREGKAFTQGYRGTPPKDQNSTIHLLEAYTLLHDVWPDRQLGERLGSLLHTVRDILTTEAGYMRLFFWPDWTPFSRNDGSPAGGSGDALNKEIDPLLSSPADRSISFMIGARMVGARVTDASQFRAPVARSARIASGSDLSGTASSARRAACAVLVLVVPPGNVGEAVVGESAGRRRRGRAGGRGGRAASAAVRDEEAQRG